MTLNQAIKAAIREVREEYSIKRLPRAQLAMTSEAARMEWLRYMAIAVADGTATEAELRSLWRFDRACYDSMTKGRDLPDGWIDKLQELCRPEPAEWRMRWIMGKCRLRP
jgi:ADP-ribose pyrophosphatase YjhB (NUDIX family)